MVTNYRGGGATKQGGGGGACEGLPLRKGTGKVLAMLKRGHKKFWGSFMINSFMFKPY